MRRVDGLFRQTLLATSCLVASTTIGAAVANAGGASGGRVLSGKASITYRGDNTTINQTSGKAFINWQGFSIPSDGSVVFNQPNQNSLTVNRVVGPDASQIFGNLLANGQIWLINSNGILFGKGSQVNVGALVATTSDITDQDYRDGRYRFSVASKNPNAAVVNQGTIRAADGGSVVLSGARVSNEGVIQANLGSVTLGSANGFSVDFDGDNLIRYEVTAPVTTAPRDENGKLAAALVSNSGTIQAAGGAILMTARAAKGVQNSVINNTGVIEATSVSQHDGEIVLDAGDGTVDAGGTIEASGKAAGQQGGAITITGNTVDVASGAKLDASGDRGGGEIRIGGDFHGGGALQHAAETNIGKATITADAITQGRGGNVAVWSDKKTVFDGAISARGGARGGSGGFVETSGGQLQVGRDATVNTLAPLGLSGTWLLDPTDIDIITGGQDGLNGSMIDPKTITDALATTAVELEATHDITIDNAVDYTSSNAFTLLAENDIIALAGIQNGGAGAVNLVAGWDGATTNVAQLANQGVYGNNGGSVFIGGSDALGDVSIGVLGGPTLVEGTDINLEAANGIAQIGYHGAGQGDIEVQATGNIDITSDISALAGIGNGGTDLGGATIGGNILINTFGGDITLTSDSQDLSGNLSYANIGNFGGRDASESGNITLNTRGGVLALDAIGSASILRIGNTDLGGAGAASGDITINAGAMTLQAGSASGFDDRAQIGNGARGFGNTGALSGNITLNLASLLINADGSSGGFSQARIGNLGSGLVSGDVNVTTTGDLTLQANDGALATLANQSLDPTFGESGNITIQSGGNISLLGNNTGEARVGAAGNASGSISVTARGDILLSAQAPSGSSNPTVALIGTLTGNSDISVTSLTGKVELDASGDNSISLIGNSQNGMDIPITGDVSVTAQNVVLSASAQNTLSEIGNQGFGLTPVAGDVTVTAANQLTLVNEAQTFIGNYDYTGGPFSGNVTITAGTLNGDLSSIFLHDIPNGDFTLDVTSSSPFIFNDVLDYTSSHNATLITGGDVLIDGSIQNSGTGNVTVDAGRDLEIGGQRASGDVSVGSAGGLTTVNARNILIDAVNGIAQIGYHGAGHGDIDVSATGNIDVQSDFEGYAGIGNGGQDVGGTVGGDISVSTSGGDITLLTDSTSGQFANNAVAVIGNVGGRGSSQSGNITVNTNGGALTLDADADDRSFAAIGNFADGGTAGTSSGDINIDAGAVSILSHGSNQSFGLNYAQIGNGTFHGGANTGDVTGNVTINAASLLMSSDSTNGVAQSLIGDRGFGKVTSDIDITTTGDMDIQGNNNGIARIGTEAVPEDAQGNSLPGEGISNVVIQSGGKISLIAQDGEAQIVGFGLKSGSYSVTAQGDILIQAQGSAQGFSSAGIGTAGGNGDISVTSLNGNVELDAGDNGGVSIGDSENLFGVPVTGNISVGGQNIILSATQQSFGVQIGNDDSGDSQAVSGNITLTAANQLAITGDQVLIGNQNFGDGGPVSGNVSITAATLNGDLRSDFLNDIPNGDFTLDLTSNAPLILQDVLDYTSSHTATFITGGDLAIDASVQNSGTGNITIDAAGDVTIGGNLAQGGVALGSFGGTTSLTAADLALNAENGFAQLGFAGGDASGDIAVQTTGDITLLGGSTSQGEHYAQIGNGGGFTQGDNTGDIMIAAGGNIMLTAGPGAVHNGEAYAQIGNGGAFSMGNDSGNIVVDATGAVVLAGGGAVSNGDNYAQIGNGGDETNQNATQSFRETGDIRVTAASVTLEGGSADASYAQIGNGGVDAGKDLGAGATATYSGNIMVTATNGPIVLTGDGNSSYAQIGNGGARVDGGGASATISGDITVASQGSDAGVTLTGGTGGNAYAQIGNGGYAAIGNVSGDISVTDLTLLGGSGTNAYAQVGNGDASKNNTGDISGDVSLDDNGPPTLTDGSGSGAIALIGNATGDGTVSGTVSGGQSGEDEQTLAVIDSLIQQQGEEPFSIIQPDLTLDEMAAPEDLEEASLILPVSPLELLAGSDTSGSEGEEPSDQVAEDLGHSLDKRHKKSRSGKTVTIIPGVLREVVSNDRREPHGVPPADQDYLSWGNEAFWQW